MSYEKLQLGGAQKEILSWANHEFPGLGCWRYTTPRFALLLTAYDSLLTDSGAPDEIRTHNPLLKRQVP